MFKPLYRCINEYFFRYIRDRYPEVLTETQTLEQILTRKISFARYGGSELKLCRGKSVVRQPASPAISRRLREILHSDYPSFAVGVPPFPDKARITDTSMDSYFRKLYSREWESVHYMANKVYLSSWVFWPFHCNLPHEKVPAYIDQLQRLWQGRDVTFVCNGRFEKAVSSSEIFNNTKSRSFVRAPDKNAYAQYDNLLRQSGGYSKDNLFLLACGPTATILAYDLSAKGYQAVDIGNLLKHLL